MQELEIKQAGFILKDRQRTGECFNEVSRNIHKKAQIGDASIFEKQANSMQDFIQFLANPVTNKSTKTTLG